MFTRRKVSENDVKNTEIGIIIGVFFFFFFSSSLAVRYFCRSVEYDEQIRRCIIFEEDSMSQKDDLRVSNSPTHDLYDLVCLDNRKCLRFV